VGRESPLSKSFLAGVADLTRAGGEGREVTKQVQQDGHYVRAVSSRTKGIIILREHVSDSDSFRNNTANLVGAVSLCLYLEPRISSQLQPLANDWPVLFTTAPQLIVMLTILISSSGRSFRTFAFSI